MGSAANRAVGRIFHSELFKTYARAFAEVTGLTLMIATEDGTLMHGAGNIPENAFCGQLYPQARICETCYGKWAKTGEACEQDVHHHRCFAGICEISVPIRAGSRNVGWLVAGKVATNLPTEVSFGKIMNRLRKEGVGLDEDLLKRAYFSVPVTTEERYTSFLRLLEVFAGHLSLSASQLVLDDNDALDPQMQRARAFIHANLSEPLELAKVAHIASLSTCHFSKKFKQSSGVAFTEYVAMVRVEAAKKLLANPATRISEVAFAVGFQSLTHFNRVFRNVTGMSPTRFRAGSTGLQSRQVTHRKSARLSRRRHGGNADGEYSVKPSEKSGEHNAST